MDKRLEKIEQRLENGDAGAAPVSPRADSSDFISTIRGTPGIVIDEGEARATPCTKMVMADGRALVFSEGIKGPLDEDQQTLFCPTTETVELPPDARRRVEALQAAAEACKAAGGATSEGEPLPDWVLCLTKEARERGVEL